MKIPEEFIGCRVIVDCESRNDHGECIGRMASWYCHPKTTDIYLLCIKEDGSFRRIDSDYAKIHEDDIKKICNKLVIEKSDRFEMLDL